MARPVSRGPRRRRRRARPSPPSPRHRAAGAGPHLPRCKQQSDASSRVGAITDLRPRELALRGGRPVSRPLDHRRGRGRGPAGVAARARAGLPHRRAGIDARRGTVVRRRRVHRFRDGDQTHPSPLPSARGSSRSLPPASGCRARDPAGARAASASLRRDGERPGVQAHPGRLARYLEALPRRPEPQGPTSSWR